MVGGGGCGSFIMLSITANLFAVNDDDDEA